MVDCVDFGYQFGYQALVSDTCARLELAYKDAMHGKINTLIRKTLKILALATHKSTNREKTYQKSLFFKVPILCLKKSKNILRYMPARNKAFNKRRSA